MTDEQFDAITAVLSGVTLTQAAVCKFLIRQRVVGHGELLAYLDETAAGLAGKVTDKPNEATRKSCSGDGT
jgi:hypothetical protein